MFFFKFKLQNLLYLKFQYNGLFLKKLKYLYNMEIQFKFNQFNFLYQPNNKCICATLLGVYASLL